MKKLSLALATLMGVGLLAQTALSPKVVSKTTVFTWDDPNVPKAKGYTVYAQIGTQVVTMSASTNRVVLGSFITGAGTYSLSVLAWDDAGDPSEPSTNYYISMPKQKLKGVGNFRTIP